MSKVGYPVIAPHREETTTPEHLRITYLSPRRNRMRAFARGNVNMSKALLDAMSHEKEILELHKSGVPKTVISRNLQISYYYLTIIIDTARRQ